MTIMMTTHGPVILKTINIGIVIVFSFIQSIFLLFLCTWFFEIKRDLRCYNNDHKNAVAENDDDMFQSNG